MKKSNREIPDMHDGCWQRLSGRRDRYGKPVENRYEKSFPDRAAVDLAVDLADPLRLRMLAEWVPLLEQEQADWARRKITYITRSMLRVKDPYLRSAVGTAIQGVVAGSRSAALEALSHAFTRAITVVWDPTGRMAISDVGPTSATTPLESAPSTTPGAFAILALPQRLEGAPVRDMPNGSMSP